MNGGAVPVPVQSMTTVPVDDSLFVYDSANQRFFRLNSSAAAVYRCCDGATSVVEIVTLLADEFAEGVADIQGDVEATVAELEELGLVTQG